MYNYMYKRVRKHKKSKGVDNMSKKAFPFPQSVCNVIGVLLILAGIALFIFITVEICKECKKELKEDDTRMKKFWTIVGSIIDFAFECFDEGMIFLSIVLIAVGLGCIFGI